MTNIIKWSTSLLSNVLNSSHSPIHCHNQGFIRSIFTSPTILSRGLIKDQYLEDYLKLKVDEKDNETHVEAILTDTGRENRVVETDSSSEACALCKLNLAGLDYTDVKILSQFIKRDGSLATYHESKLCPAQYRKVRHLIRKAQRCNLIQRPSHYLVPGPWHDLNTYLERDRRRDQPMKVIKKEYWRI